MPLLAWLKNKDEYGIFADHKSSYAVGRLFYMLLFLFARNFLWIGFQLATLRMEQQKRLLIQSTDITYRFIFYLVSRLDMNTFLAE